MTNKKYTRTIGDIVLLPACTRVRLLRLWIITDLPDRELHQEVVHGEGL